MIDRAWPVKSRYSQEIVGVQSHRAIQSTTFRKTIELRFALIVVQESLRGVFSSVFDNGFSSFNHNNQRIIIENHEYV